MIKDTRLVGTTAENIFLSLLNERGIFATSFDTAGFDGIVFDSDKQLFKHGDPPFYVQIKCRGSKADEYNPQGHSPKLFQDIIVIADELKIPETSLYLAVGFFKNSDIRTINFFCMPLEQAMNLFKFKSNVEYRFSYKQCEVERLKKYVNF